jgi:hypothetical protein
VGDGEVDAEVVFSAFGGSGELEVSQRDNTPSRKPHDSGDEACPINVSRTIVYEINCLISD